MIGTTISHYKVLRELGRGGMGVVYEAEDLNLGRKVALKFLPAGIGSDGVTFERFRREARILSSLNHPNICTIYEVGQFGEEHFIAMELLEGEPLKRRIASALEVLQTQEFDRPSAMGPLNMDLVIDWAIQLSDALDAAHTEGVIHRDIKPDNIFISKRGFAKLLDFGLAKTVGDNSSPELDQLTRVGAAVGTLSYMSPEQALGRELDPRTDLFSLGVVLYEMTTSRLPFVGPTMGAVFDGILHHHPPTPLSLNEAVPPDLDAIIMKCLRKDAIARYQSAAELCADLKRSRGFSARSGVSHALLAARSSAEKSAANASAAGASAANAAGAGNAAGSASTAGAGNAASSAANAPSAPSTADLQPLRVWMKAGWAGFVLLALISAGLLWKVSQRPAPTRTAEPLLQRLTTDSGLSLQPALSRDAKFLAYASDRSGEGNLDIWLRQIGGSEPIRMTHDPADDSEPDFSPDGTMLAFHSDRKGGGVYVMPVLGGQEHRLADGGHHPRFSPDGQQIAYWTSEPFREVPLTPRSAAIYVVDTGGGQPRRLPLDLTVATRPLWTPDGSHILFWGAKKQGGASPKGWWVVPAAGGPAVWVTFPSDFTPAMIAGSVPCGWRAGNVVFSMRHENNLVNIYEAPFSFTKWQVTGPPHRLTFGTTQEESPSVAADGRFAFASLTVNLDVYSLPIEAKRGTSAAEPRRLTQDTADDNFATVSTDGRTVAFQSLRAGHPEIWIKHLPDGKEERLANGEDAIISPDGAAVAFVQDNKRLMILSTDGGVSRQVSDRRLSPSAWSPDQLSLMVAEYGKPKIAIELVDVASGKASAYLADPRENLFPRGFSPDGRWISFSKASPEQQAMMIAPFRPASPPAENEWIAVKDSTPNDFQPYWSADGSVLYFISERDGFACLWALRMNAATQQPVSDAFPVLHLHGAARRMRAAERFLSVAKDKLVFSMEERTGSIWMMQFQ